VQKPTTSCTWRTRIAADADLTTARFEQERGCAVSLGGDATWNVVRLGVQHVADPRSRPLSNLPPDHSVQYYLNVDQWDGFPERRRADARRVSA
jgi:hypothetical protein